MKKNVSNYDARPLIEQRKEFSSHTGNFRGEFPTGWASTGALPQAYAIRGQLAEADYVVYSYSTPIAWHLPDGWVIPDVSYSITTSSKHQPALPHSLPKSASHLESPWGMGLKGKAITMLRQIRAGRTVTRQPGQQWAPFEAVVTTGEAAWNSDRTAIVPTEKG